jgi:hypothetical protein
VSLTRVFWIGAAGILVLAALVAVSAILSGDLDTVDAQILGTLAALLVAGGTAVCGLALVERNLLVAVGWATAGLAVICFLTIAAAIWNEFDNDTLGVWAGRAIALLIALLIVGTQCLLLRNPDLRVLVGGTALMTAIATGLTFAAIETDETWQPAAIFWILTALGYLLLPMLQRFTAAGTPKAAVRVLGALNGVERVATRGPVEGVVVDAPSPGERLVLRHRG